MNNFAIFWGQMGQHRADVTGEHNARELVSILMRSGAQGIKVMEEVNPGTWAIVSPTSLR